MKAHVLRFSILTMGLLAGCDSNATEPGKISPERPALAMADEDVTAPTLTALSFSPGAINTTTGSAIVTVSYTVTDDISGAIHVCPRFTSPSETQLRSQCDNFSPATSRSGTIQILFPLGGEPGTYKLSVFAMSDAVGNQRVYSTADLATAGFPTDLDVTSVQDNTAPNLTALSFSPAALNTTSGSAFVTVSYTVTDDISGAIHVCLRFTSPSETQFRSLCDNFDPATSRSNTIQIFFPQGGEPGTYRLSVFAMSDAIGNQRVYTTADLSSAGFLTDLNVTSVQDVTAPTLTALNFSPVAINTTTGSAIVTVSYTVTDDISGAIHVCPRFTSPSETQLRSACDNFDPATSRSSTIQMFFPQGGESGTYKLSIFAISDAVGNQRVYSTADLTNASFPTDLLVNTTAAQPTLFLRGSGGTADPPTLFLNDVAPTGTTAKYKDSQAINFAGGNPWKNVGTWNAGPTLVTGTVGTLGDVHLWLGLKNSDDTGTRFDVRVEAHKNGTVFATGEVLCVRNVVRNANSAKEVAVGFAPFSSQSFNGSSDVLSLRVLTRVGTNGSGGSCGGHSNAAGLRTYFDATTRPARF